VVEPKLWRMAVRTSGCGGTVLYGLSEEKALARIRYANGRTGRYQPRTAGSPGSKPSDYADLANPKLLHRKGSTHNIGINRDVGIMHVGGIHLTDVQ
jgi:hypothetical protein